MLIPAVFALAAPAAAQGWQEYNYPDYSFMISFPAEPQIQTTTYPVGGDRTVNARVYAVRRDDAEFKVTVADLGDLASLKGAVMDNAVKTLSAGGEVKVNVQLRIHHEFGRQLSILQGDGSRTSVALFNFDGRLYQIEGKSLPSGGDATADAIRFVQSLDFIGDGSSRSQRWHEYSYPDYSFTVAFPTEPQIQTTTYPVGADRTANARIYAGRDDDTEFKLTVADLGDPLPEEAAVIDNAIKTLSAGGEVKVNIPHRINRVFGRRLSILQGDGSRISAALFDYNGRLYQIEGKSRPSGRKTAADAIRFVQSLTFTGAGSNRSPE
jgi:hypothetical protein